MSWYELDSVRQHLRRRSLSFYVDKVQYKAFLKDVRKVDIPDIYFAGNDRQYYHSHQVDDDERDDERDDDAAAAAEAQAQAEADSALKVLHSFLRAGVLSAVEARLARSGGKGGKGGDASFVAKPTHMSCSDGVLVVDGRGRDVAAVAAAAAAAASSASASSASSATASARTIALDEDDDQDEQDEKDKDNDNDNGEAPRDEDEAQDGSSRRGRVGGLAVGGLVVARVVRPSDVARNLANALKQKADTKGESWLLSVVPSGVLVEGRIVAPRRRRRRRRRTRTTRRTRQGEEGEGGGGEEEGGERRSRGRHENGGSSDGREADEYEYEYEDDDAPVAPALEYKVFVIWGKVWAAQVLSGSRTVKYLDKDGLGIRLDGTTGTTTEEDEEEEEDEDEEEEDDTTALLKDVDWWTVARLAERLAAHKDMFRVDIFVGVPAGDESSSSSSESEESETDTSSSSSSSRRLRYYVNEVELYPTNVMPNFAEAAKLWHEGYASGNYVLPLHKFGHYKQFKFVKSAAVQSGTAIFVVARPWNQPGP